MLRCSSRFPDQTSVPQPTATSAGKGGPAPWGQGYAWQAISFSGGREEVFSSP